jgi:hypothetical protein
VVREYNIAAAARRLVSYWECRKELFGERAFLPMTQLEKGALSEDDVAVLQTGYLALLPDDTDSCAVVCYDGSRLGPSVEDLDGMKRLRCLFYTLSVVSEKRRACVDGFVCIEIVSELSFEQFKGCFFELAEKVQPVHLKALHLVNSPPTTAGTKEFSRTIVPATVKLSGATLHPVGVPTYIPECPRRISPRAHSILEPAQGAASCFLPIPARNWRGCWCWCRWCLFLAFKIPIILLLLQGSHI